MPAAGSPSGSSTRSSRWPTGATPPARPATAAAASAWPWPGGWWRPSTARSASTTRGRAAASPSACRCTREVHLPPPRQTGPEMRVLVTGGAGFIGSHIVEALLDRGADVRVIDSLDPSVHGATDSGPGSGSGAGSGSGSGPGSGAGRAIAALELDPRAELLVGDLGDPAWAE